MTITTLRAFAGAALLALAGLVHAAPAVPVANLDPKLAAFAAAVDQSWDKRDHAAMAKYYAPDATATIGNASLKGQTEILGYFTKSLAQVPAGFTHRTVVTRVEKLGNYVVTDNAVYLEKPNAASGKDLVREFFTMTMLAPKADGWEIVAVRSVPLAAR